MNLIQIKYKMDTIFMNSKNSKTSDPHTLLLNLSNRILLKCCLTKSYRKI